MDPVVNQFHVPTDTWCHFLDPENKQQHFCSTETPFRPGTQREGKALLAQGGADGTRRMMLQVICDFVWQFNTQYRWFSRTAICRHILVVPFEGDES